MLITPVRGFLQDRATNSCCARVLLALRDDAFLLQGDVEASHVSLCAANQALSDEYESLESPAEDAAKYVQNPARLSLPPTVERVSVLLTWRTCCVLCVATGGSETLDGNSSRSRENGLFFVLGDLFDV